MVKTMGILKRQLKLFAVFFWICLDRRQKPSIEAIKQCFPKRFFKPIPVDFVAQTNQRVIQINDANQLGFKQLALKIMRGFYRFAILLNFIASHL
jgi:hypothetical protein